MPQNSLKQADRQLLEDAFIALERESGLALDQLITNPRSSWLAKGDRACALLKGLPDVGFFVEPWRNITTANLGSLVLRHGEFAEAGLPFLAVSDYVSSPMAERLREAGVQFIDTAGNASMHLDRPVVHVWSIGKRPERPVVHRPERIFRSAGLRVLFPLLCLKDGVKGTYRDIATWADVGLGTVKNTFDGLQNLGFLVERKSGRQLRDRDVLMEKWAQAWALELRPKLRPQRFHVLYTNWWQEFGRHRFEQNDLWLGGEGAAYLLTEFLSPGLTTVYGSPDLKKLAAELKPTRAADGNLEVLPRFWNFDVPKFDDLCDAHRFCPPLLIYADLVATGQARQREAAHMIKERYLADN